MNQPDRYTRPALLPLAAAWAGLVTACVVLVAHARRFDFLNDDAFISFRYAENLVRHGELTYNPGERVEGYTNFLWTVIMAAVLRLGADPVPWSKAIGISFSLGTLFVLFFFSTWWARTLTGRTRSPAWAALAPLLLALAAPFAAWSEGGLETALFTFLATTAALLYVVELVDERRRPWSAVAAALAAMTRPDGLLLFALLAAHRLGHLVLGARPSRIVRPLLRWAGLFAVVFGPYWAWRYGYYGYPFPNTYYAKSGPLLWGSGGRYVRSFVSDTSVWVVPLLLALPWRGSPHGAELKSLVALIATAWAVYVAGIGGDFMGLHRFLVPVLPLLALGLQEGLASLWRRAVDSWESRALRPAGPRESAVAVAAVLALLAASAAHNRRVAERALEVGSKDGIDSIGWLKQFVGQTATIGRHLASTYPPGTRIATSAAGAIPYYSRMPTLDLIGLNDLHVAHEVPAAYDRPGHRRSAPEPYVLRWHPHLLVLHPWISADPPVPHPAVVQYWRDRRYAVRTVLVPGLQPPYWSYLEAQ